MKFFRKMTISNLMVPLLMAQSSGQCSELKKAVNVNTSTMRTAGAMRIAEIPEIPYGRHTPSVRQTLDLYLPKDTKFPPLVVWIHGGGFSRGDKTIHCPTFLAKYGYAVASINYRYSSDAPFPAQICDCNTAVRFLRDHAKRYGFDGSRIAVFGTSAGGTLAALVGIASSRSLNGTKRSSKDSPVQAVIDWSGVTDIPKFYSQADNSDKQDVNQLLGGPPAEEKKRANMASPIKFVHKGLPPFLVMHGDSDDVVPPSQSQDFYKALKNLHVDAELHIVPGGKHFLVDLQSSKLVVDFLARHLKPTTQSAPNG
jgi:acetyl esterase/lipase